MFPLWDIAIAPVLAAARAKCIVEIGAFRGENTEQMLDALGPDSELHVIDPVPDFDPDEHEARFPGRYFFHRAPSIDVLPTLPPVDAALIDGDHNWYTVYNELKLLTAGTRGVGAPLPLIFMHDVLWPYGRRDLYYAPEQIPAEFRQPFARAGMRPGRKRLRPRGGLNAKMNNAEVEGGPRNGVMTALDDFVAEYDKPLRRVVLPIYFGLAIVVEEERLEREPELSSALNRFESTECRYEMLVRSEELRIQAMVDQHDIVAQREAETDRARRRYLGTVKSALLNEHYLDHEIRMAQLNAAIRSGREPYPEKLRDPVRRDQQSYQGLVRQRLGPAGPDAEGARSFLPYTAMGRKQLDHLEACLDAVRSEGIAGDLVECGTARGGGAIFMRAYLDCYESLERRVWVADRFRASPHPDLAPSLPPQGVAGFCADFNLVRDAFQRFDLFDDRVRLLEGSVQASVADAPIEEIALLRIGRTAGDEAGAALAGLYDRVAAGGFVIVDDEPASECRTQVDAFRSERGIDAPLERIDSSAVAWRKAASQSLDGASSTPTAVEGLARIPLAPGTPTDPIDLSVVVVFYNMRREAQRTLHSLSRAYQEQVDDVRYEVIVVENGSDPEQRLGEKTVSSFGSEFRYIDMGEDAQPSPVPALNRGIREARGRNFALMIDGAHVLTPGVLHFGLAGLATYAPAIVATQQWHVGPGEQSEAMDRGYDEAYEDRLFEEIEWPHSGYRLFEIGHFAGDRDWLDGVWESNCMFATRATLERIGCFDETFSMPGGGFANLELYERLGSSPDITVCSILGEGSFHQTHGGDTTNQPDAMERRARVFGYREHFARNRGRPFHGPGKPIHYVGRFTSPEARRTRSRRMSAKAFAAGAAPGSADGPPVTPVHVPEELKTAFTEAVWRSMPWTDTSWLGRRVESAPTDLVAYQEVIADVRPDWILETGTGDGGRTLFLASICDLVGHGNILSVDDELGDDLPQHPRIRYQRGKAHTPGTAERIAEILGEPARTMVVLGSCADRYKTTRQLELYAPFVSVGSYVIVTDTIVNGHPVWPAFGPGPTEAVKKHLAAHGEFSSDPNMEKYSLTFNPGGFLRRVR